MNAIEDDDLLPEAELYELFRPRRPDATAFREGVERKIAERGREREETETRVQASAWRTALARRAASVLPPEVATALLGGKLLSTALALPALVLASTVGAFVASARSLGRSSRNAAPATTRGTRATPMSPHINPLNRDMAVGRGLIAVIQAGAFLLLLAPLVIGRHHAADSVIALLVISMAALTTSVRGFSRAGLLSRGEVASLCAGVLSAVFAGSFLWVGSMRLTSSDSELGLGWSAAAVLMGLIVCVLVARRAGTAPLWTRFFLFVSLPLIMLIFPFGWTRASPSSLRGYLANVLTDIGEFDGWSEVEATFEALRGAHEDVPDLTQVRAQVENAIDQGKYCHPELWTAAARMGLIDAAHRRKLAARKSEAETLERLLAHNGRLGMMDYDAYQLDMLLATHELTDDEREGLVARVEASWPKLEDSGALDEAALCARLFDTLGRVDAVERHRDEIHAILERSWISGRGLDPFVTSGGFTSYPGDVDDSFVDSTWQALDLMARVGTPPDIDLRMVRGFLRAESTAHGLLGEFRSRHQALARAGLFRLEHEIGLPPRSWLAVLLGERVFIGSILIVALCLIAIRSAPPSGTDALSSANGGAQP